VEPRKKNGVQCRSDAGNLLIDLHAGVIEDPSALDSHLRAIPGVIETGLFCGRADVVLVSSPTGLRTLVRP
jgi:ribose 5-phosphate isomerase A